MNAAVNKTDAETVTEGAEIVQFPNGNGNNSTHYDDLKAEAEQLRGKNIKDASAGNGRTDIFKINPLLVNVDVGFNKRDFTLAENIAHVEKLAAMIAEDGVQEPVTLFQKKDEPGTYYLADGECRYRATLLCLERGIEIRTIPAKLEPRYTSDAERIFAQYRRNSGKNFTPMELAANFHTVLGHGYSIEQIAKKAGFTVQYIEKILEFDSEATPVVKEAVASGQISASLASTLVSTSRTSKEAEKSVKTAVKNALARGKTKATAKDVGGDLGAKLNLRTTVRAILDSSTVKTVDDSHVRLTMTKDDYNKLIASVGL